MFRNNAILAIILSASLACTGCANKKLAHQDDFDSLATEKAEQFAGDSEKALDNAENAYQKAKDTELDFFAPLHMEKLRDVLKQARGAELEGKTIDTIQLSAKVVTFYESGLKNKEKVEALLPALIQQKNTLDEIKAPNILPGDYKSGTEDFKDLISLIETGDEGKASKNSESVLKDLQQVELGVMLTQHWKPAKDTLDKAEDENADTNAAKTFEYAENLVNSAERIIRQSYTDRDLIAKTGLDALRASQHVLYINREVASLVNMNKSQAEIAALRFEDYLGKIGTAIKANDVRHMSLQDQTLALKQFAEEQSEKIAAEYKQQIAALNTRIKQLTADQIATNEKAEKVQPELDKTTTQQPNISITVNQPFTPAAEHHAVTVQQPATPAQPLITSPQPTKPSLLIVETESQPAIQAAAQSAETEQATSVATPPVAQPEVPAIQMAPQSVTQPARQPVKTESAAAAPVIQSQAVSVDISTEVN